jgi:hypothetical protein
MKKIFIIMTMILTLMVSTSAFAMSEASFEDNCITVTEIGLPKAIDTKIGAKKAHARRAAVLNAYRQLLEEAKGVWVKSSSSTEDLAFGSEVVNARVEGVVKNAKIVKEEWNPSDETYTVTVEMPLFGTTNSLASAIIPDVPKENICTTETYYSPTVTPTDRSNARMSANGNYTGLIVDCSGLGLEPTMGPTIVDANNKPFYGLRNIDHNAVVQNGMCSYSRDINNCPRAGSNPLVVRAIGFQQNTVVNASPMVSNEDALRILAENERTHFLDRTAVVFIR